MINISDYEFGKITINGTVYTSDLKIFSNKIFPNWWRKEGHKLYIEDIKDILEENPHILIIGCGANSMLEVDKKLVEQLKNKNIKFYIVDTYKAVELFNRLYPNFNSKIALCIHLTC